MYAEVMDDNCGNDGRGGGGVIEEEGLLRKEGEIVFVHTRNKISIEVVSSFVLAFLEY